MADKEQIKILLVDDHPLVREGLKARLETQGHLTVLGEAENAAEAIRKAQEFQPDIVFMDIGLPDRTGLEATKDLHSINPTIKVIVLTVYDNKEYLIQALRSGAKGYILKNAPSTELISAVEMVHSGKLFFPAELSQMVMEEFARQETGEVPKLTARERQVLGLIASGRLNKEIADDLDLSVRTVETHRENIMKKLDIRTVAGLTRYAISQGIARLD